jgi:hypothetical protein
MSLDGMSTGQGHRHRDGIGISTTRILALRAHATGPHHRESAISPQLGAGAYVRLFVRAGMKSRAPE